MTIPALTRAAARHDVPAASLTVSPIAIRNARRDAACELYESGMSLAAVAAVLGTSGPAVRQWLVQAGVPRRGRGGKHAGR